MAQRGREAMAKRARERARQERKEAKKERRDIAAATPDASEGANEEALMEEFRVLSERHAAGHFSDQAYGLDRHRISVDLGIETEADAPR